MNYWTKESMKLATGRGYLDKLQKVYPVAEGKSVANLSKAQKEKISEFLKNRKKTELLKLLFGLKRFPYDEPFIGFLRQHPDALKKNPKTIGRIWKRLEEMGVDGVVGGIERPMSASRRFGQTFRLWVSSTVKYCKVDKIGVGRPVSIDASDSALAKYARNNLGYKRKKGLDLVILGKRGAIIGEAKFLSTSGGTQGGGFREAITFVKKYSSKSAIAVAVIDGVIWAPSVLKNKKSLYYRELNGLKENQVVLSALLLPKFIKKELR